MHWNTKLPHYKTNQLLWNKFRITYFEYSLFIQFNIIVECNDLGLVRLGTDRMLRLELMKKLKDEGYNSKEISEFLNVNGIRPLRTNNPYSPQLVWVTLNKYETSDIRTRGMRTLLYRGRISL